MISSIYIRDNEWIKISFLKSVIYHLSFHYWKCYYPNSIIRLNVVHHAESKVFVSNRLQNWWGFRPVDHVKLNLIHSNDSAAKYTRTFKKRSFPPSLQFWSILQPVYWGLCSLLSLKHLWKCKYDFLFLNAKIKKMKFVDTHTQLHVNYIPEYCSIKSRNQTPKTNK